MLINPGSHRPQGPWDPDKKEKYLDTRYFWTLLPLALLMGAAIALVYFFGG